MKPADDSTRDYKRVVIDGYDACADAFNRARRAETASELKALLPLPEHARVLDLGCGGGAPVARDLVARGVGVIGVDISSSQLAIARREAPAASFLRADMEHLHFAAESFDAVVSLYAIFHVEKREQVALFSRIYEWLRPGGLVLMSVGMTDEPSYTEPDFFGVEMFWSNYSRDQYRDLFAGAGFKLLGEYTLGHGYGDDTAASEAHPLFLVRKPA